MSDLVQRAFEWVGVQSLQIVPLALALVVIWRFTRRASAHGRYLMGVLVLVKCVVPGFLDLPLTGWLGPMIVPAISAPMAQPGGKPDITADVNRTAAEPLLVSGPVLSPGKMCSWVWVFGAGAMLVFAGAKAIGIQNRLRRTRVDPDLNLECEFLELSRRIGLRGRPKLCLLASAGQPFVWGILRGCIYLPEAFPHEGKTRERQAVLAHELAHVLRWDALLNLLQVLVQAVFWFHPVVWWLNARLRHEREKCCDEMAIASLRIDPAEYGSALVEHLVSRVSPAVPPSSLAMSGKAKELEDRLKTILRTNRSFHLWPNLAAVLGVLAASVVILPAGMNIGPNRAPAAALEKPVRALVWETSSGQPADAGLFSEIPTGQQQLGGVSWLIQRVTEISRPAVMTVGSKFQKLHLLHGLNGTAEPGAVVGKVRFRYLDGRTEELPIRYGEHLQNCCFAAFSPVRDPGSAMVWTGSNAELRAAGQGLRLYRTTFANPRPTQTVTAVEYSEPEYTPRLLLAAVTIE